MKILVCLVDLEAASKPKKGARHVFVLLGLPWPLPRPSWIGCDPYVTKMLTGQNFDYSCHSNLTRAVLPYGLTEFDVHDVLNIFQVTGLNDEGRYFMKASPAKKGDFFEFFAEIDLLCAISTCPGGDLSMPLWGPEAGDTLPVCRPPGVEIYRVSEELLRAWTSPQPSDYAGNHGLKFPVFGQP